MQESGLRIKASPVKHELACCIVCFAQTLKHFLLMLTPCVCGCAEYLFIGLVPMDGGPGEPRLVIC